MVRRDFKGICAARPARAARRGAGSYAYLRRDAEPDAAGSLSGAGCVWRTFALAARDAGYSASRRVSDSAARQNPGFCGGQRGRRANEAVREPEGCGNDKRGAARAVAKKGEPRRAQRPRDNIQPSAGACRALDAKRRGESDRTLLAGGQRARADVLADKSAVIRP